MRLGVFLVGMVSGILLMLTHNSLTTDRTETVFVYGTLQNPFIRTAVCLCFIDSEPTTVSGYKKVGRNIVPHASSTVAGRLITVSSTELRRLDRYERTPDYYERQRLVAHPMQPWVYRQR